MTRRSSLKLHPHSSNSAVTVACAAFLVTLLMAGPAKVQAQDAAAALGIGDTHGSLSFAPWEKIDTYTGNVLLSFTDLDLPGNAGFNLTVRRYCNSKNGFGCYLDYGFPGVATTPSLGVPVRAYPIIVMPDGSQVRTLQDPDHPTQYRTTTLWLYDAGTGTLKSPNGVTYHYDQDGHPWYKEDPFGNRIDVVRDPNSTDWSLVQTLKTTPEETRTVTFSNDGNGAQT